MKLRSLAFITLLVLMGSTARFASAESTDDTVRIALLPVLIHSSASREYLRGGLVDMLVSRLEQIDAIDVIRVDDVSKATSSYERASETARELGADYVLFGSFTQFGQGASLDVQLAAIGTDESPMRQIFIQSGTMGDVIPDLDGLVGKISRFAVTDFDTRASADPPLPGAPKREALAGLRERVRELEAAMRRLDPSFDADRRAAPGEAPSGAAVAPPANGTANDIAVR